MLTDVTFCVLEQIVLESLQGTLKPELGLSYGHCSGCQAHHISYIYAFSLSGASDSFQ